MRILITGYEGFIGKNTYFQLRDNFQIDTIGYGRGNNEKELEDLIIKSDYIIHCAGVNITNDDIINLLTETGGLRTVVFVPDNTYNLDL